MIEGLTCAEHKQYLSVTQRNKRGSCRFKYQAIRRACELVGEDTSLELLRRVACYLSGKLKISESHLHKHRKIQKEKKEMQPSKFSWKEEIERNKEEMNALKRMKEDQTILTVLKRREDTSVRELLACIYAA